MVLRDEQNRIVQIDHGLLTYALLQAFTDRDANKDGDEKLVEREWLDYSLSRVPQMRLEAMNIRNVENRSRPPGQKRAEILFVNGDDPNTDPKSVVLRSSRIFYRREMPPQPFIIAISQAP